MSGLCASLIVVLATAASPASKPSVCWPGGRAEPSTLEALRAAASNVELLTDCSKRTCRAGQAWCLSCSDGSLVLWSGRTRLAREVASDASSVPELVADVGATIASVYLESLAVEASLTEPDRPSPPPEPEPEPEPQPEVVPTATVAQSAPPPDPAPPIWPTPRERVRATPSALTIDGSRIRAQAEGGVRFRSPGGWGPTFAIRVAVRPAWFGHRGDRWSIFGRVRGAPSARTLDDELVLDVADLGGDLGVDWVWLRRPRLRCAFEAGASGEWLRVRELASDGRVIDRDGGLAGAFVGPTLTWELGGFELGAVVTGYSFPLGLRIRKDGEEAIIGRWGLRAAASAGWRF